MLSSLMCQNGGALLAEGVRRGARPALIRAFLASWRGAIGPAPLTEAEVCVELLAAADLTTARWGGASLNPSLKATWCQPLNLRECVHCFQLEPCFLSLHPYSLGPRLRPR